LGGLGLFATFKGLNIARQTYEKGGNTLESFIKGASVLITETLKTMVNAGAIAVEIIKWPATGVVAGAVWEGTKIAGNVAVPAAKIVGKVALPITKGAVKGVVKTTSFISRSFWNIGKKFFGG
jgi:hypothetical protein